jgi:hypothetical protein
LQERGHPQKNNKYDDPPTYGDVWLGDIDMIIKVPKKFAFIAIYFNGKKEGISLLVLPDYASGIGGNKPKTFSSQRFKVLIRGGFRSTFSMRTHYELRGI